MDFRQSLVAYAEPAKLAQPRQGALDDPPQSPKARLRKMVYWGSTGGGMLRSGAARQRSTDTSAGTGRGATGKADMGGWCG